MQDFYGWRARIGLIYPSSSTVMEPELYAMAPEGVSIRTTRQDIGTIDVEGLRNWVGDDIVERCTRQLAQASLHSIILGGTSASFIEGWDEKICARMEAVSGGIPATTATTAVTKALVAFNRTRVSFVTAYTDEVNERGRRFLSQHGFSVVDSAAWESLMTRKYQRCPRRSFTILLADLFQTRRRFCLSVVWDCAWWE
jgi:maleate isomerase